MLKGTQRLFPTQYEEFENTMVSAAEKGQLPVGLQLDNAEEFDIRDFRDLFDEFMKNTGLGITGTMFNCPECGRIHILLEVDYLEDEE